MPLTKTTAAQNEDAHSYYRVRGLYFMAVVFERSIISLKMNVLYNFRTDSTRKNVTPLQ